MEPHTDLARYPLRAGATIDQKISRSIEADHHWVPIRLSNADILYRTRINGDLNLDVMPLEKDILGFTNTWYRGALQSPSRINLPNGLTIQVITAPFFLGTKMETFRGRGRGDFQSSRDLDDFVAVVDGREDIIGEITGAPLDLCEYLSAAAGELLSEPRFIDALPGYLLPDEISQRRLPMVRSRLQAMAIAIKNR